MYVSIDMGGTKTRIASSKDFKQIHKIEKFLTESSITDQKSRIEHIISNITDNQDIDGICFGFPGILDQPSRKFKKVPNYKNLESLTFDYFFNDKFGSVPLFVQNDAALAGLAEAVNGAGTNFDSIAYLTLSTGVGGVKIEHKSISVNQKYFEPGHQVINFNGDFIDGAGVKGSLETFVSGKGFENNYGVNPENCRDVEIWKDYSRKLAAGLINVIVMWNPEVIVLGGSMSNKFDVFYEFLKDELKAFDAFELPEIRKAQFMDDAGIMGGFIYLSQNLIKFIRT